MEDFFRSKGRTIQKRMTVVRLSDQSLLLHSPVGLTKQLQGRLEVLGEVRHVISPNTFYFSFLNDYLAVYPEARFYAPPGRVLSNCAVLKDGPEPVWEQDLDQVIFLSRILKEAVFFHRLSQTLILTDLCRNIQEEAPFLTKTLARFTGSYQRFTDYPFVRWTLSDRPAARAALQKILNWDFERIILAQGRIVEGKGKENLRQAFAWLE